MLNTLSKSLEISKFKLITGIVIGLFYAFIFYAFLYLLRTVFRVLSVTEDFDLWILTDKEVHFYNLIFAYIAVIIAQSICFTYWLERPRKIFEKKYYKITTIVNDQRVLNWYFLSWFSKMAFFFGIMFGDFNRGFYVFSFYPKYNYLFILIIIVLFLQTWSTIRLHFKDKSFKWMLLSALFISVSAFGLSKINLIDYKAINETYLENNVRYNYNLKLPEVAGTYKRISYRLRVIDDIYVVKAKDQEKTLFLVGNKKMNLNKLKEKITAWKATQNESEIYHSFYRLHIDKTVKMKFVNELNNTLAKFGVRNVAYAIVPKNPKYDIRYYRNFLFYTRIRDWHSNMINPKKIYNTANNYKNIITINHDTIGQCFINKKPIDDEKIKQTIKDLIVTEPNFIIKFYVDDNLPFSDYLKVFFYSKQAINELRNQYAKKNYGEEFDWSDNSNYIVGFPNYTREKRLKKELKIKMPFTFLNITTDFIKLVYNN